MRDFESDIVKTDDIPWPEIAEIKSDGLIAINYASNVTYIPCT